MKAFTIILLTIGLCSTLAYSREEKDGKILSVFQVVSFPNDPCSGTGNKNGTCYTTSECSNNGGKAEGSCADGYGVCCTFTANCGSSSNQNCTYFESSGVASGACRATICPCGNNICQLRLDFNTFTITGPSTLTTTTVKVLNGAISAGGKGASTSSQCLTDTFTVTSPGGASNAPVICGTNTGEHMYVDASQSCNELAFQLNSNAVGATAVAQRNWNIKVTQYDCNSPILAPPGCTQYFYGATNGQVRSFNYNNGGGYHLANQNQKICIRKEKGQQRICWYTAAKTDFTISGKAATGNGKVKTCCGYGADGMMSHADCVIIPSASKQATKGALIPNAGICGQVGLVSATGMDQKTICSQRTPFQLRFITDSFEIQDETKTVDGGFEVFFVQA